MNELDESLKELAIKAQGYPFGSKDRNRVLHQIWNKIQQNSHRLCRPFRGQFTNYQQIHAEAVHKLLAYACQNIDQYDPNQGEFLQWAANHKRMKGFFEKAYREVKPIGKTNLQRKTLQDLEELKESSQNRGKFTSEQIIAYVAEDPEGIFRSKCLNGNNDVNFQILFIKYHQGYSFREIAQQVEEKYSTVHSFYHRNLSHFAEKIKAYLRD
ncbi:MAG: hypothetical protein WA865_15135 [Spirulinaceae cyanobacterium]